MKGRLVVLASGDGTNCAALIDACSSANLDAEVAAVVTNRADAGVLRRASAAGVETVVVQHRSRAADDRLADDAALADVVASFDPDLVVLAGWMRLLGSDFCARFRVVNLHPAKPGEFAGTGAIGRAFEAWRSGKIDESGVMVHWVPDEAVDVGPVIATVAVPFEIGDDLDSFEHRVHIAEHQLIVEGVRRALSLVASSADPMSFSPEVVQS